MLRKTESKTETHHVLNKVCRFDDSSSIVPLQLYYDILSGTKLFLLTFLFVSLTLGLQKFVYKPKWGVGIEEIVKRNEVGLRVNL